MPSAPERSAGRSPGYCVPMAIPAPKARPSRARFSSCLLLGDAPRLVQHEQARELAGLRAAYQHAMQPDDDEFGQRRLDVVRRQCEQRQHHPLVQHRLERGRFALWEQSQIDQGRQAVEKAGRCRLFMALREWPPHHRSLAPGRRPRAPTLADRRRAARTPPSWRRAKWHADGGRGRIRGSARPRW